MALRLISCCRDADATAMRAVSNVHDRTILFLCKRNGVNNGDDDDNNDNDNQDKRVYTKLRK